MFGASSMFGLCFNTCKITCVNIPLEMIILGALEETNCKSLEV